MFGTQAGNARGCFLGAEGTVGYANMVDYLDGCRGAQWNPMSRQSFDLTKVLGVHAEAQ